MTFSLAKWSFVHAVTCITAVCTVFLLQNGLPLFFAGLFSFVLFITLGRPLWTPHHGFGTANQITLVRLFLALSLFFIGTAPSSGPLVFSIALIVLIVDGLDGWMARRNKEASEFGEYFDKETDAFFLLILCLLAYFQQKIGAWIVIPGLLRYLFVVALVLIKPEINKEYRSKWARVIYVTMIIALLAIFITPSWFYSPLVAAGTTGIFLSFAHYFRWMFSAKKLGSDVIREDVAVLDRPETDIQKNDQQKKTIIKALLSILFLNSVLLLPSFIANLNVSTFFPIPDPSKPLATLTWTRGWYDYALYFFVRRPNQDLFRICADLILLVSALVWWKRRHNDVRKIPGLLSVVFIGLVVYEIYDAMVFQFFHRHGIVYEDAQYVLNLYYLAIDAFSLEHLFNLILLLTGIVLFAWLLPPLYRTILAGLAHPSSKKMGLTFSIVFWPLVIGVWLWYGPGDERPLIRSISGKMVVNAGESVNLAKTIQSIEQLPVDRVYEEYDGLSLTSKPVIYLFMVESYGSVLRDDTYLRAPYDSLMLQFDEEFSKAGLHSASRLSTAPVSGGLSWLSMNSVLSGIFMKNRTFYTRYTGRIHNYPHLVRYLKQNGYYTLTLQPPNKARLGLPIENNYSFDKTVFFDDLHYTGRPYSIWVIPDQYSLGYTHENYLPDRPETPYFFFFETATTHAPWTDLPPYLSDWQQLNETRNTTPAPESSGSVLDLVKNSYNNRFSKDTPRAPDLYLESIRYDLLVLKDYILEKAPENSLFIIIGDHQPPLLPSTSYDTPLHVISSDSSLVLRFANYGFVDGMLAQEQPVHTLTHAGIYSMLIDVLTHDETRNAGLPSKRYRPEGIAPSVLTTVD